MNRAYWRILSPVGWLTLMEEAGHLTALHFGAPEMGEIPEKNTPLLQRAQAQLTAYFQGELRQFTLLLAPQGTDFQQRCWQALQTIPFGQTWSYAQQAEAIGQPKALRAVGMANHRNPLPILIPCHRVVGKNGSLTGYAGGLEIKRILLEIESKAVCADGCRKP